MATSANFTPTFGHRYTFVVTATDNVRNTGQGTATTDAIQVTKYYYIGSSRVAMRRSATTGTAVTYLHTDHLGTVSIATSASAQVLARTLNMPYGSVRWTSGTMPTDWGFTGQKDTGLGLVYLHARYYSSWVGRFVSPDTIVPEPGNPQQFNRFSYTLNNPLRYIDPSGHEGCTVDDIGSCKENELQDLISRLGIDPLYNSFIAHWLNLLQSSPTGLSIWYAIQQADVFKGVIFDEVETNTLRQVEGGYQVVLKLSWFMEDLNALLSGTGVAKMWTEGLNEFHAHYAAVIGHELFHIAIGDQNDPYRAVGDSTGMAYRVEGKIINELLFNGDPRMYKSNTILTRKDAWNYHQTIPTNLENFLEVGAFLLVHYSDVIAAQTSGSYRHYYRVTDPSIIPSLIDITSQ